MSNELPDPVVFCTKLAEVHKTSQSPNGKFGFYVSTCNGRTPQVLDWDSSWVSMFGKFLAGCMKLYFQQNNTWPELKKVSQRVINKVVPRLLGPLQSDGRSIKPTLIHGDLWEGNIGTSLKNRNIYVFDAAAFYAHYEMELGSWRGERHKIADPAFMQAYLDVMGMSEPVDQFDDRNRLYGLDKNITYTIHHPEAEQERMRQVLDLI